MVTRLNTLVNKKSIMLEKKKYKGNVRLKGIIKKIYTNAGSIIIGIKNLRFTVVSPTVCSPMTRVDSPMSYMSVGLRLKTCLTTADSSTLSSVAFTPQ